MNDIANAPRYSIGIDLGTTHSALAYVDSAASDGEKTSHGVLTLPQLTGPGSVEALPLLPSFLYLPHADELPAGALALPWTDSQAYAVGEFARSRGATTNRWVTYDSAAAVTASPATTARWRPPEPR